MKRKYEFHMPDGSIINSCIGVDRYYNLGKNNTRQRLRVGWTVEECANNKRVNGYKKYEFHMPDGRTLKSPDGVDRYYNLGKNVTRQRLKRGWTEEECVNNERVGGYERHVYKFHMPDDSILTKPNEVDKYYNLCINTTRQRLKLGWSEEECANNKRVGGYERHVYKFHMPDGSILTKSEEVDRYYNLGIGVTRHRLRRGWTEEECVNNKKVYKEGEYEFRMPDGSVLTYPREVDRYYNLGVSTTRQRLKRGWTEEECARDRRLNKPRFHMPDGSILNTCKEVDEYYNLGISTTTRRLKRGWTEEECANNNRSSKYEFHMPNGSILTSCRDVDKYHSLRIGSTSKRLYDGWTEGECAWNKRGLQN